MHEMQCAADGRIRHRLVVYVAKDDNVRPTRPAESQGRGRVKGEGLADRDVDARGADLRDHRSRTRCRRVAIENARDVPPPCSGCRRDHHLDQPVALVRRYVQSLERLVLRDLTTSRVKQPPALPGANTCLVLSRLQKNDCFLLRGSQDLMSTCRMNLLSYGWTR